MRKRGRLTLGPHVTEGARLLWTFLGTRTIEALRRELGRSRGVVNRWLYADRLPDLESMAVMRDRFAIPIDAWTRSPSVLFQIVPAAVAAERPQNDTKESAA